MALTLPFTGCVMLYAPMASAPGRYVPPMTKGEGDFAVDVSVGRNVAYGVGVEPDGTLVPDEDRALVWAGFDLALRHGLSDDVGIDARITTSILVPFPFPVPNGLTLAPIFSLFESEERDLSLHVSPRLLWINGFFFVAGPSTRTETKVRAFGAELPVMFTYRATKFVDLQGTAYFRGFYNTARQEDFDGNSRASWPALGGGLTLASIFTSGHFRFSMALGLEIAPHPGQGMTDSAGNGPERPVLFIPQGGISLGTTWD